MRSVVQPRLRSSTACKSAVVNLPCDRCERGSDFHLHCMVCRAPLEFSTTRKTCAGECRAVFKTERRKARSVRCWISREDAPGKRFRRWLPKRFATPRDTVVSKASAARGAIPRKETGRRLRNA